MSIKVVAVDKGYYDHRIRQPGSEEAFAIKDEAAFAPRWMRKVDSKGNVIPLTEEEAQKLDQVVREHDAVRSGKELSDEELEAELARRRTRRGEVPPAKPVKKTTSATVRKRGDEAKKPEHLEEANETSTPEKNNNEAPTGDKKVI